jgi:hypothetical protein
MATDTAFTIALIAVMGAHVPVELRIFLTAAAILMTSVRSWSSLRSTVARFIRATLARLRPWLWHLRF